MCELLDMAARPANNKGGNSFWGVAKPNLPYSNTPEDRAKKQLAFKKGTASGAGHGGTAHSGHGDYQITVIPGQVRAQMYAPKISKIASSGLIVPAPENKNRIPVGTGPKQPKTLMPVVEKRFGQSKDITEYTSFAPMPVHHSEEKGHFEHTTYGGPWTEESDDDMSIDTFHSARSYPSGGPRRRSNGEWERGKPRNRSGGVDIRERRKKKNLYPTAVDKVIGEKRKRDTNVFENSTRPKKKQNTSLKGEKRMRSELPRLTDRKRLNTNLKGEKRPRRGSDVGTRVKPKRNLKIDTKNVPLSRQSSTKAKGVTYEKRSAPGKASNLPTIYTRKKTELIKSRTRKTRNAGK